MWPFKTNQILKRCVLPLAIRPGPLLWLLLVANFYGGIQLGNKVKEETINNVIKMALHKAGEPVSTFCETNIYEKTLKR